MDQSDSERRIADLERQLADAEPTTTPQHFAHAAPPGSKPPRRRFRLGLSWLLPVLAVLWVVACFVLGGYDRHQYHLGTQTNAIIQQCVAHNHRYSGGGPHFPGNPVTYLIEGDNCTATWELDAQSQHGPIVVDGYFTPGTNIDVHVRDGKAYASNAGVGSLKNGMYSGAVLVVLGAVALWLRRR